MPFYNFKCKVCGESFEEHLPMDDHHANIACPNGHANTERVYSAPTVMFKGRGFYVNDKVRSTDGK